MKKKLNLLFVVILCLGLLAGCQEKVSEQEAVLTTESPLLLECNTSDIQSNSWITLDTPEGKCEFTPFISLRDGTVEASDTVFVQMWDGSSN